MDLKNIPWSRMNPIEHKKIGYKLMKLVFDGDHAAQNNYAVRKKWTVEAVMEATREMEELLNSEQELKAQIENFKEQAAAGEVVINLKDLSDDFFYDSVHWDVFWRVSFELYKMQSQRRDNQND